MPEHLNPRLVNWASILHDNTREQAEKTSAMPFIHPHMALMPDAHLGKGATVGSVIPTLGAIMPAAVGVDIGCGMNAVRTQFTREDFELACDPLSVLRESIERVIPLSAGKYNQSILDSAVPKIDYLVDLDERWGVDLHKYTRGWEYQLGSLGSGNHFIEISVDEADRVWLFLHSGSRGVGNRIATKHIKVAQDLMKKWWISLPDPDLAYLVEGTDEFWTYVKAMNWAQEFARLNREEMMDRVVDCVSEYVGEDVERLQEISCHHNYTEQERHFGKKVWLSRKGAIDASEGTWGLIPGSMGDKSYVVVGKGNPVALNSAPHGAGREHSRNAARKLFTMDDMDAVMGGVEYRRSEVFLDEIPGAYKPIDQVMSDATDLVEIRHTLKQIVNVKGD